MFPAVWGVVAGEKTAERALSPPPSSRRHRGVGEVAAWGPRQAAGFLTLLIHQVLVKRLLHKGRAVDTEDPAGHKADPEICPTDPKGAQQSVLGGDGQSCGWRPGSGR